MEDNKPLKEVLLVEIQRLNAKVTGLVAGLVSGIGLFIATNWLVLKGGPRVGEHLQLLREFFPGYSVTFVGSLIGFAYAFVAGFVLGYLVTVIYNFVVRLTDRGGSRP